MASIKSTLGVTLHENMSVKKMVKIWTNDVTQEVKDENPELDALMITCGTQTTLADTLRDTEITVMETYENIQLAIETASAVLVGNLQQPAALAAQIAAEAAALVPVIAIQGCKTDINAELDKILEA